MASCYSVTKATTAFTAHLLLALAITLGCFWPLPVAAQTPGPTAASGPGSPITPPSAAPQPLPLVPNADPWFGAVQAIYAPQAAYNAGVSWQRLIFPWEEMQPSNSNELRPGWFSDAEIDAQRALGFEIVGITLYTPRWAARDARFGARSVPNGLHLPVDSPQNSWASFIKRLVSHYRGRIDTWVFYNEPDLFAGDEVRTFAGTPVDYYMLLKTGYLAAKSVNPNVKIVMAGLTYWWDKEHGRTQYLQRVLDAIAGDSTARANNFFFDAVDVHAYGNPLNSFAQPTLFRRILASKGMNKPIWIIESNVLIKDDARVGAGDGPFRATLDEQASYVIQSMALARAAGVSRYSIYKMKDEFAENGDEYWGLTRNDATVRPSYVAYQVAVRYFQRAEKATYSWAGGPAAGTPDFSRGSALGGTDSSLSSGLGGPWLASATPPTEDQITVLLASNANHHQWPWPAPVNLVTMERGAERISVVWNASPEPVSVALPARAPTAWLIDKYGRTTDLTPRDGAYTLLLEPSRNNSDPRDPSLYLVGGSPWIVVEDLTQALESSPPRFDPFTPLLTSRPAALY